MIPKVSVCVITYNQEKYIRQCLASIVSQETNFQFEIIIGDDCSTDGTTNIVLEFAEKYPEKIRPFCHRKNIGGSENNIFVHSRARGEYIAHMDGDDYALPGKLQIQADFLDRHPDCNLLWTPVIVESSSGILYEQNEYFKKYALKRNYSRADLIKYGTVGANSSKMYRRLAGEWCEYRSNFDLIDYFINVIQVGDGVASFSEGKPLGVYRVGIGTASKGSGTKNLTLESISFLSKLYPEYRLECNVAALVRWLADLKNRRTSAATSRALFFETFHWCSLFVVMFELRFIKSLTFKNKRIFLS